MAIQMNEELDADDLLVNVNKIHTTEMGLARISKNLTLHNTDIVEWCKRQITHPLSKINRKGKNWYVASNDCVITVNAHSYTIITAHTILKREKEL